MVKCVQCTLCKEVATAMATERSNGQNNRCKIARAHICQYAFVLTALKCNCLARPREIRKKWHMLEKFDILIFRPEIPYCESINVVYFLGEKLFVFSRKFSKTATAVKCPKLMPRVRIQKLCSSISQKEVGFFEIYILV